MKLALVLLVLMLAGGPGPSHSVALEERRTYYPGGQLLEVRHFLNGREEGLQQAWTEDGEQYLNYEMRNGRRYGFINARPCLPVEQRP